MNIKHALLLPIMTFLISISGCQLQATESDSMIVVNADYIKKFESSGYVPDKSFQIQGKNHTGVVRSSVIDAQWNLGEISLKYWPLEAGFCEQCDITLDRHRRPDGETIWLKVKNEWGKTLYIVSSYQSKFYALGWGFYHDRDKVNIIEKSTGKETNVVLKMKGSQTLNSDEKCSLIWSNIHMLKQPGAGFSDDVTKFRSQFIIQCEN